SCCDLENRFIAAVRLRTFSAASLCRRDGDCSASATPPSGKSPPRRDKPGGGGTEGAAMPASWPVVFPPAQGRRRTSCGKTRARLLLAPSEQPGRPRLIGRVPAAA